MMMEMKLPFDDIEEQEDQGFTIADDGAADWVLRKIKQARERKEELHAHYKRQMEAADRDCERTEEWGSALLKEYFDTLPTKETKTQMSYALPSGKLVFKRPTIEYERDPNTLHDWLVKNGYEQYTETVVTKKPHWAELKKITEPYADNWIVIKETGELVEGVVAVTKPARFVVEV